MELESNSVESSASGDGVSRDSKKLVRPSIVCLHRRHPLQFLRLLNRAVKERRRHREYKALVKAANAANEDTDEEKELPPAKRQKTADTGTETADTESSETTTESSTTASEVMPCGESASASDAVAENGDFFAALGQLLEEGGEEADVEAGTSTQADKGESNQWLQSLGITPSKKEEERMEETTSKEESILTNAEEKTDGVKKNEEASDTTTNQEDNADSAQIAETTLDEASSVVKDEKAAASPQNEIPLMPRYSRAFVPSKERKVVWGSLQKTIVKYDYLNWRPKRMSLLPEDSRPEPDESAVEGTSRVELLPGCLRRRW